MKWIWIILLIIVGIIAAVFAVEYLTVGIGHLPSWVPGHGTPVPPVNGKCPGAYHLSDGRCYETGHMHKRGALAALIAIVAFVWAGWLIYKNQVKTVPAAPAADPAS
jgi:hypothetical protein